MILGGKGGSSARGAQAWLKNPPAGSSARARSSAETSTFLGVSRNTLSATRCMLPSSAYVSPLAKSISRFKDSVPVILNLQSADTELSKRLIDFASGLTYALNGGMQRVADKVFLLTPRNVEVSAEQRAQLLERGGFYNQA